MTQQSREAASYEGRLFTSTNPREFLAELIWFLLADWETQFGSEADLGHEIAKVEARRHGVKTRPWAGRQNANYKTGE